MKDYPLIYKLFIAICLILIITSCSHHRDVRPGTQGVHHVKLKTGDTDSGEQAAINQAQYFCEKRDRDAAFVSEEKKYTGTMDEEDYKSAKKLSRAAQTAGYMTRILAGKRFGTAVGIGGSIGDSILGKEYQVDMKFRCI